MRISDWSSDVCSSDLQADQPVGPARDVGQPHMRILLDGTAEVRRRDERAQIVIALLVLRIERQPVDQRRAVRQPLPGPRDAKQGSDDRLYPSRLARLAEKIGRAHV